MAEPASPRGARLRSPSWLDGRLVLGLLLVLLSVVVGARVLAAADRSDRVYALTHDIASGTTLTAADLRVARVRLLDGGANYVSAAGPVPVGWITTRPVGTGEFLPRLALLPAAPVDVRLVTVPVAPHHFPAGLRHGDLVDVYLSAKPRSGSVPGPPVLTLGRVTVDAVNDAGGGRLSGTGDAGVVLQVPAAQVPRIVGAVEGGDLNLVRVPASLAGSTRLTAP